MTLSAASLIEALRPEWSSTVHFTVSVFTAPSVYFCSFSSCFLSSSFLFSPWFVSQLISVCRSWLRCQLSAAVNSLAAITWNYWCFWSGEQFLKKPWHLNHNITWKLYLFKIIIFMSEVVCFKELEYLSKEDTKHIGLRLKVFSQHFI